MARWMSLGDFTAFLAALGSAGPWVILVAVLLVVGLGLVRKWVVLGWMFEDVEQRLARSIAENEKLTATNDDLVDIITTALMRRNDWDDNGRSRPKQRVPPGQGIQNRDAPR
jgi:hypothetical protein